MLAAAATTAAATAGIAEARTQCPPMRKQVATNELVRIYETRKGTVRACWRASGRTTQLTSRRQEFRLGELAGRHVAYSVFENDASTYFFVERVDAKTGRLRVSVAATRYQSGDAPEGGGARIDEVRLAASGVAWTAWNPLGDQSWEVGYVPGGTVGRDARIVGTSPTLELGSLAVGRRYLYWSATDGTPHRARY